MYLPDHFEETRLDVLRGFIAAHPLGALVLNGPRGIDANHIPFLHEPAGEGCGRLLAHVARANPVWQEIPNGSPVLVIFRSGGAYVSPNWYPSKHETHQQVPTWNYQAVHVHGTLVIHDDAKFVRGLVGRLTREHENRVEPERPWRMADSPQEFIDRMVAAIVGIEVRIDRIIGKWKLGQNRADGDRLAAADVLEVRGDTETAEAMRKART
jgi:transcriptional regulator